MKLDTTEKRSMGDAECKAATGKTLDEWFAYLDEWDGLKKGRREMGRHIYFDLGIKDDWWSGTIYTEYERARGAVEKDGRPTGYSLCSTKLIKAPIETVYNSFLNADTLNKWLGDGHQVDAKEGGSLSNSDGNKATLGRLRENKDIRMTWHGNGDSAVEVMFKDLGGKIGITLNHNRIQDRYEADALRAGWSDALAKLKTVLES